MYFIQHEPDPAPGQLQVELEALGVSPVVLRAWEMPLESFQECLREISDAAPVVVLGGTMNAYDDVRAPWLAHVCDFLRRRRDVSTPTLGICLGHQLIARAFEGVVSVSDSSGGERGVVPLTVSSCAPEFLRGTANVFEDHFDVVSRAPAGAKVFAWSPSCIQGMRVGSIVGVQFHPEMNSTLLNTWYGSKEPAFFPSANHDYALHEEELKETCRRIALWLTAR